MTTILIFVLFKLIISSEIDGSLSPLLQNKNESLDHKTNLSDSFYDLNDIDNHLSGKDDLEDDVLILSKSSTHKKEDSTLIRRNEPLNTVEEPKSPEKRTENSEKAAKEVPLTSGKIDSPRKKVTKPVLVSLDKIGTSESKRSKKDERKLNDLIDSELLSKTNLKGDTLSLKLSNHLITKLTENLGYFSNHPSSLVDQLEKLSNEKLPKEYKGKLLSELSKYRGELELISSEADTLDKTDKETISKVAEAKEDLNSKFAGIIVPILVPLLKPLLENIIIRITSKDFYEDIKNFFDNLFKIKSDPGWTFWKGFKRIFFGKTDEEVEELRSKELDKLFTELKDRLDEGLAKEVVVKEVGEKGSSGKDKDREKTLNNVRDPKVIPKGEVKKEKSEKDKEENEFIPPAIKESTNDIIKNRKKLTEEERKEREAELEGIDLESISPLPEPLTPEEKEETERAERLFKEGRVKEYRELVKRLNDYYKDKINKRQADSSKNKSDSEEERYYPEVFKHLKNQKSGFIESSMLLALALGVFYAYVPKVGDHVIGVITNKNNDYYTVNINDLYDGFLLCIDGFRGATKKIKPQLTQGDVIFCQILCIYNYNLIELTCKNVDEIKSFSTNETYFGQLTNGMTIRIPLPYSKMLCNSTDNYMLTLLKDYKFQIAIGFNGKLWVNCGNNDLTLKICRFIKLSYGLSRGNSALETGGLCKFCGLAVRPRDIEITMPYGKVMKWNKFDKHKFWKDVTVSANTLIKTIQIYQNQNKYITLA
ncbi:hypothetical protein MACJ_002496 [Theileria orientalis]|uniref:S1 motif domain-containing protein n=1 Tax=Theileria orientalis TaxID=68886 RepID=A0A976QSD6_THEOR|nr:hypothetical protein MACJ_002496 [Theileria orientalis]